MSDRAKSLKARYSALLHYTTKFAASIAMWDSGTGRSLALLRFLSDLRAAQSAGQPQAEERTARARLTVAFGFDPGAEAVLLGLADRCPVPPEVEQIVRGCWGLLAPLESEGSRPPLPFAQFMKAGDESAS